MKGSIDPQKVAEALRPLVPLVEKWGAANSDDERYALADRAQTDPEAILIRDRHQYRVSTAVRNW